MSFGNCDARVMPPRDVAGSKMRIEVGKSRCNDSSDAIGSNGSMERSCSDTWPLSRPFLMVRAFRLMKSKLQAGNRTGREKVQKRFVVVRVTRLINLVDPVAIRRMTSWPARNERIRARESSLVSASDITSDRTGKKNFLAPCIVSAHR